MKVLVVEDEPIIAFDLENLVLDNGFEIAGLSRTRAEALSLAPKADIALVDVQWPMARLARRLRATSSISMG